MIEVTDEKALENHLKTNPTVLALFYSSWCAHSAKISISLQQTRRAKPKKHDYASQDRRRRKPCVGNILHYSGAIGYPL